MSLFVLNSSAYITYTPPPSDEGDDENKPDDGEEDEDDQSRSCEENVDDGTAICAWISRPKAELIPILISAPPDIQPFGVKRGRVASIVTGIIGHPTTPPAPYPVPAATAIVRSRGARHGVHRVVGIPMDTRTTRFVRIWSVALDRRRHALCAITFLFELRHKPRGGGVESIRLIERDRIPPPKRPR
ncbi:MAG: hypothetical protein IPH13_05120 [Planctomycetes bacterium]|nr:hypothetical protein [Planctomycetota bacterium]MCC7173383.1 hypothetical protein [Planctomycetota bacterium]